MRTGGSGARTMVVVCVVMLVLAIAGMIATPIVNALVLDKYDAYGEVAIPGSARLHLPAGEVAVSFHAWIVGTTGGIGLPVPPLQLTIDPPPGVPDPQVTESIGGTITVNNDARVRVWVVRIPADGTYDITTDGKVSAFINPRLAFGHSSSHLGWIWAFVALFVVGVLGLVVSVVRAARARRAAWQGPAQRRRAEDVPGADRADELRMRQIKTLAELRDSGALTEEEFEAEKRRVLDGF